MTVATFGAIAIHQLTEAVGVMLFYAVGLYFQDKAIRRSRRSITALLDIQPDYANLKAASGVKRLKPEEVAVGEVILVKPGEKVPLDGEVIEGVSTVDTSALTGEAVPRTVRVGETVLAGMINGHGLLTVRVTKPFSESSVARILHLVEKAGSGRRRWNNLSPYLPIIIRPLLWASLRPLPFCRRSFCLGQPFPNGSTGRWYCWSFPAPAP